ncbi:Cell cycle control protein [Legionella massiliensis]|uniref:Cell cycle control protein n=1 Tax=Legionella massiliensis TaxID=1034943 RepID=A0A078KU90_9GAMM|nr:AAA family ATPase [Legionella massiliensis]CDZ76552.1 Cell cycle control protein [Legionella massiliensis]CEE12290.1 Regulator of chromosome condensation (RCC1) repeat protein [Legionella massiliensis]
MLGKSEYGFFSTQTSEVNRASAWQLILSDFSHSLFFNPGSKSILGFGKNSAYESDYSFRQKSCEPWTIPLRSEHWVKQVAAGDGHLLILYENGLLEGYGRRTAGQLGIGSFINRNLKSVSIQLPADDRPLQIAAARDYSLVISERGILYGFGDNRDGQLGLGKRRTIEFPTAIPLPEGVIPDQIFTANNRTIIACKNGELFGFGCNTSFEFPDASRQSDQKTPLRLHKFELLKPRSFGIGEYAVIVLSQEGECFFYGVNIQNPLPVDYINRRTLILPSGVKPVQIAFSHKHLILLTEQGEIWETRKGQKMADAAFVQLTLPARETAKSIGAGWDNSFIFTERACYGLGPNSDYQLGLDAKTSFSSPQLLPLCTTYSKSPDNALLTTPLKPEKLFLEQEKWSSYQDNTEIIEILAKNEGRVIEIIRPQIYDQGLILSTLYTFYSNRVVLAEDCFQNKKIAGNRDIMKGRGTMPVILLDLGGLDFSSGYALEKSYSKLMAALYLEYRIVLFEGYLKDKGAEQEDYQEIATEANDRLLGKALLNLTLYLYQQYGQKVKLLINNADIPLRSGLTEQSYQYRTEQLKGWINPAIGGFLHEAENPSVSQTILMGIHPSSLGLSSKHIQNLSDLQPKYRPFLKASTDIVAPNKSHFLYGMKVSPEICEQIGCLLEKKTLQLAQEAIAGELFPCLIQLGLLRQSPLDDRCSLLSISDQQSLTLIQGLHKKWQLQNLRRVTVVWDIDHVLATHEKCTPEAALFFLRRGYIISALNITHYIPPGIIELMRYQYSNPLIKVAFFSSGDLRRNKAFVAALLTLALGEERYKEIAADIIILSGANLRDSKKDISLAIAEEDEIENAIFIDNDPRFVYFNQDQHYLHSETVQSQDFADLNETIIPCASPADPLFHKVNAPFYLASILHHCISNKDTVPVVKKLAEMQTGPQGASKKNPAIYGEGLALLKPFNSDLMLVSSESFRACIVDLPSEEQKTEIDVAKEHEYEECRLM